MSKILITSTDVMMYQFLLPHVQNLYENGYVVDVACSYAEGYQKEGYHDYIRTHIPENSSFFSVSLERNPASIKNIKGCKELKQIIENGRYDLIWTNEPVMGVMTRLAGVKARSKGAKIFYLVHGYHFFKGAPTKNWFFYPVEKVMSLFCDAMGMINWEDYYFTQKHMPKMPVFHIDGIGFDPQKFHDVQIDRKKKREELGFTEDDILVLSVGELQGRKNHEPVLRAIAALGDSHVKYIICGWGELKEYLLNVAKELNCDNQFFLLGHRYDIPEILKAVDIFVHPSQREGLGIAALEAMASGLPVVSSNVQGLKDFIVDGKNGYVFNPNDIDGYKQAIETLVNDKQLRKQFGDTNIVASQKYSIHNTKEQVLKIINDLAGE